MEQDITSRKQIVKWSYWLAAVGIILITATLVFFYHPESQRTASISSLASLPSPNRSETLDTLEQVMLSNTSVVRSGVALATVSSRTFNTEIDAVGILEVPEPSERTIAAWARGRIQHLYVSSSGEHVRAGEPLYDFYSPDILNAEREYLIAMNGNPVTSPQMADMPGMNGSSTSALLRAARERLLLYGLSPNAIDRLNSLSQVTNTVTIDAPASGIILQKLAQEGAYVEQGTGIFQIADLSIVWAEIQVPESEIRFIRMGQTIPLQTDAYPDERFDGRVILISSTADQASRTVRVRMELPNSQGKLRPGMTFVSNISMPLGPSLAIPQDAVIRTGKGDFVWMHTSDNMFTAKPVTLGALSPDDYYQVVSGLDAGDEVAAQGAFLVDAEYQISKNNPMVGMNMGETGTKNSGEGTATVVSIDVAKQTITLNHSIIPGLMPAMTMGYKVSDPKFLQSVTVNEPVRFTLTRMPNGEFEITAIAAQ